MSDRNEITELWSQVKEERRIKKQSNYEFAKKKLKEEGIEFVEKPNSHFALKDYNFWATTGLYIHKKTNKRGRGIFNLIKKIK